MPNGCGCCITPRPDAAILVIGPPDGSRHAAKAAEGACPGEGGRWTVPPRLAEVREAQRQVAHAAGYYFWDWSAAMGGACSMPRWARTDPPMGAADHVHLLTPGYRATADLLFAEIMRGYARYRDLAHIALMLFPTLDFLLFFVVVAAVMVPLRRHHQARKLALVVASYVFYAQWNWHFCLLLAFSSVVTFAAGRLIAGDRSPRTRRRIVTGTVCIHLAILGTFKYFDFFVGSVNALAHQLGLTHELPFVEIILPVGISFFTFHGISYVVDVYRGDVPVCRRLTDMLLYLSFFPQLVAGPIVRASFFLPQLYSPPKQTLALGPPLMLILGGLFKKVVMANYLATDLVDPVFFDPASFSSLDLLLAAYGYAIQIYCDFSAYSDMAIGLAALLGYRFPPNFNQPYRAQSLQEFWRRWHISLSSWLRDYLYKPLGGSRNGRWATTANLMITMLLGGIWHGAAWKFVAWGGIHGAGLVDRACPALVARTLGERARGQGVLDVGGVSFRLSELDILPGRQLRYGFDLSGGDGKPDTGREPGFGVHRRVDRPRPGDAIRSGRCTAAARELARHRARLDAGHCIGPGAGGDRGDGAGRHRSLYLLSVLGRTGRCTARTTESPMPAAAGAAPRCRFCARC